MLGGVDGDGEGDAVGRERLHGGDAHHLARQVHQGTPRVARVYRRVRLYEVRIRPRQPQLHSLANQPLSFEQSTMAALSNTRPEWKQHSYTTEEPTACIQSLEVILETRAVEVWGGSEAAIMGVLGEFIT